MPKNKKYKNLQAVMSIKLEDGTLKPLMTFQVAVSNNSETTAAIQIMRFEEDMIKQNIKFEYTEESNNGESSS